MLIFRSGCHYIDRPRWSKGSSSLAWQVSPSYDIIFVTATNEPDNNGMKFTDSKRKIYGIWLVERR